MRLALLNMSSWRSIMIRIGNFATVMTKMASVAALFLAIAITLACGVAQAASISIVALGASNTNGKGVGSGQAWPAVLESMLRAKGYKQRSQSSPQTDSQAAKF